MLCAAVDSSRPSRPDPKAFHAFEPLFPAHPPRDAEGSRDRLAPADAARRHDPAGSGRASTPGCRSACGCSNKVNAIIREEQNRSGAIELLMPTIQSADLWRESGRYDAYGKEMLRIKDRHERDMLYGPTNEEMITDIFRAYVRSYKDLPLNLYHIQWKFRDEVRPRFGVDALARVPDEGRLFLRPRPGGRAPLLQQDVRRLSAHLRPAGAEGDSDARRHRPDRRRSQPRVHHPGLDRRERGLLPRRLPRLRRPAGDDTISTTSRGLQGIVDRWTSLYAATSEMHDAAAFEAIPSEQADVGARHRGRPYLLLRHQVFRPRWAPR